MEQCFFCKRKGVTYTSTSEDIIDVAKAMSPHNWIWILPKIIKSKFDFIFDEDYEKTHVQGEILKCKFCGAYHVECFNCLKISVVANKPKDLDEVICPHCSKIMVIGNTDLSNDSEVYTRPFGYHK